MLYLALMPFSANSLKLIFWPLTGFLSCDNDFISDFDISTFSAYSHLLTRGHQEKIFENVFESSFELAILNLIVKIIENLRQFYDACKSLERTFYRNCFMVIDNKSYHHR